MHAIPSPNCLSKYMVIILHTRDFKIIINFQDNDDDISDSLLQSYISTEVPTGRNISSAGKRYRLQNNSQLFNQT